MGTANTYNKEVRNSMINIEEDYMCCGQRLELMPYSKVWSLGCKVCKEPVFIVNTYEIGGN